MIAKNQLTTCPRLSARAVQQYLPKSLAMAKGHLDQQHKNTASMTTQPEESDFQLLPNKLPTHEYYCAIVRTIELNHIIYSDLKGQFPVQSSSGHQYILAVYDYDSIASWWN